MRVVVTDRARDDLRRIGELIARHDPVRAHSFTQELLDACDELGVFPRRFRLVPSRGSADVRQRVYGNYLIFYELLADHLRVLTIVHGARDLRNVRF